MGALTNDAAREFTHRTMIEHYVDAILYHHPDRETLDEKEITLKTTRLLGRIFGDLLDHVGREDDLPQTLLVLGRKNSHRIHEWFSEFDEAYNHYKKVSKLPFIGEALLPHMQQTKSFLDFGCGDGEIACYLARELGLESASGVDVLDWRSKREKDNSNLVYYQHDFLNSSQPVHIPMHECGLMHAMLHHVSDRPDELVEYVKAAKKVISNRLFVVEDVLFDLEIVSERMPGIESLEVARKVQRNYSEYLEMPITDQRDVMIILDLLSNSLAMGIPEMNFPFGAQELTSWIDIFSEAGLTLEKVHVLGFQNHMFHRMSQSLFVLKV